MRRRHAFIPRAEEQLEVRLVLSQGVASGATSVLVGGLSPRQQVLNARQQPITAEVNLAFEQFKSEYGQARSSYYASVLNQTPGGGATSDAANAFKLYTIQRVSLLAQEVVSSFLQSPRGTAHANGQSSTVSQLAAIQLINPKSINGPGVPSGILVRSLMTSIPTPGALPSTQTLYSLSQDNAIDTARVSILNSVTILRNGYFGNQSFDHKHHS